MNHYNIFCTGGFDSTYRLIELARMEGTVQPVYASNPERESMPREIANLGRILDALRSRQGTRANFLPLKVVDVADIPADAAVTAAAVKFQQEGLGTQYDFLARLSRQYPDAEVGLVKASRTRPAKIRAMILRDGGLKENAQGVPVLDWDCSSEELKLVFGHFSFPMIEKTVQDMLDNIRAWGYEDILSMVWFCHEPLGGKPCGMCRACEQKMEGGLEFMLPPEAQRRHKALKVCRKIAGPWLTRKGSRFIYRHLLKGVYEKG